jgi:hypothetical protein
MRAPFTVRILTGHTTIVHDEATDTAALSRCLELVADAQAEGRHLVAEVHQGPALVFGLTSDGLMFDAATARRVLA